MRSLNDSKHGKHSKGVEDDGAASDARKDQSKLESSSDPPPQADYSSFTVWQKRWIILAGSFASFFSPMTGAIYFPALEVIARDLHVSNTQINLTVTTYLIIQGLAPMFVAGFSDKAGRRPAYIFCFVVYIASNLGLSLQNSYPALLVLRMVQSAGSSGTIALVNGLVGDLVTSADRGAYIAFASLGAVLGPSLAPVVGGLLSEYLDWHWIFWFLLILSTVTAVPFLLFMPETCRNLVDDGSVPPPWTSWNLTDYLRHKRRAKAGIFCNELKLQQMRANFKLRLPSPVSTIMVMFSLEVAILLLVFGLALAAYYAICTGASNIFTNIYGFNQLDVGLIFLSLGGGGILSAFTTGQMVDANYRRHARRLNFPVVKNKQADMSDFPLERARLEMAFPLLLLAALAILGYGWMMLHKISLAGPVIMLFIFGYTFIAGTQCLSVLLVDICPGKPAAATAANNVVRCLLGAAATAAIDPMSQALGYGWAYTILAVLFAASCSTLLVEMRYGMAWRRNAKDARSRRHEEKQNKAPHAAV